MRAVLTYHSIDDSRSPISIAPAVFAEHVRWLAESGVRVVPLDRILDSAFADDEDLVAVTFDDGVANVREAAARLADHGLPATIFVVTGHVGRTNAWRGRSEPGIPTLPLLDWPDLARLAARGITIGAHTQTHARLTGLSRADVEVELGGCVEGIRARLGVRPSWFAYPYGAVNAEVATVASAWFAGAVTTRFSAIAGSEAPLQVPRLDAYYLREPGAIQRWGSSAFAWWMKWVRLRRDARETLVGRFSRSRPAA